MSAFSRMSAQALCIPKPTLTDQNLEDQTGAVVIVTGGYAGVGYELVRIMYGRNATVYVAGRSRDKADKAMSALKSQCPISRGQLAFLQVDLADLSTIRPSVDDFLRKEDRLDVIINNAGVMNPPIGTRSAQGHDVQLATNCLGPFLFTKLFTPLLQRTAATSQPGSVRVSWAGSIAVENEAPSHGGLEMTPFGDIVENKTKPMPNYAMSKVGNVYLAAQYAARHPLERDGTGIVSNCFNPGLLKTELQRHFRGLERLLADKLIYPTVFGAYTELFAGWSKEAGIADKNGAYIWPWGRFGTLRNDIQHEIDVGRDGKGKAVAFWDWCERETQAY